MVSSEQNEKPGARRYTYLLVKRGKDAEYLDFSREMIRAANSLKWNRERGWEIV